MKVAKNVFASVITIFVSAGIFLVVNSLVLVGVVFLIPEISPEGAGNLNAAGNIIALILCAYVGIKIFRKFNKKPVEVATA